MLSAPVLAGSVTVRTSLAVKVSPFHTNGRSFSHRVLLVVTYILG